MDKCLKSSLCHIAYQEASVSHHETKVRLQQQKSSFIQRCTTNLLRTENSYQGLTPTHTVLPFCGISL